MRAKDNSKKGRLVQKHRRYYDREVDQMDKKKQARRHRAYIVTRQVKERQNS